jgi:Domain of unknown function (DUF4160)
VEAVMPEISRFFGIIIQMFVNDHAPPHFHATYQRYKAMIEIETGIMRGNLPPRIRGFVEEWRLIHLKALRSNWERGVKELQFKKIKPLE